MGRPPEAIEGHQELEHLPNGDLQSLLQLSYTNPYSLQTPDDVRRNLELLGSWTCGALLGRATNYMDLATGTRSRSQAPTNPSYVPDEAQVATRGIPAD